MSLAKRLKRSPARILTIDIERLPGLVTRWDQRGSSFVSWKQFKEYPSTLCWAARWLGNVGRDSMMFEAAWKNRERMVQRSWELFDAADAVVTFNGDRFDIPKLRGDWIKAGLKPPRPYKSIDLYREVKKFGFLSNSLDHTSQELGLIGKQGQYSEEVAFAAMLGNREAQREMRMYNAADVEVTEQLHERLLGWMPTHPHLGRASEMSCNQCGSESLTEQPVRYRAVVLTYRMYRCDDCGGIVRTNFNPVRIASTTGVRS